MSRYSLVFRFPIILSAQFIACIEGHERFRIIFLLAATSINLFCAQPPRVIVHALDHESALRREFCEHTVFPILLGNSQSMSWANYNFLRSAFLKDLEAVQKYLQQNADINARGPTGYTALHLALYSGRLNYELLFFLLDQEKLEGNIRNESGLSPFNFACEHLANNYTRDQYNNCYHLFKKLLARNASISKNDMDKIKWNLMLKQGFEHKEIRNLIEFTYEYKQHLRPQAIESKMAINTDA